MLPPTQAELADFRAAVHGAVTQLWPSPRTAGETGASELVREIWALAAEQGWTELAREDLLSGTIGAIEVLGRLACPLPLLDIYATLRAFRDHADIAEQIEAGAIRPIVGSHAAEVAEAATHVLLLPSGAAGEAVLHEIAGRDPAPGLAQPAWSEIRPGEPVASTEVDADEIRVLLRLGLVVRATAAARATHELALEHAKVREAFGRPIGAFQAVSHRCANCELDLTASGALVEEAVRLFAAADDQWQLAAELAVAFGRTAAPRVQFGAQHTLAAIGFFEEHEAPWLFRRVHGDVARLSLFTPAAGEPADRLLDDGQDLPRLDLGEPAERFRVELQEFLDVHLPNPRPPSMEADPTFTSALAAAGYIGMAWPPELGGQSASAEELLVLREEIGRRGGDTLGLAAADLLGNAIWRHGTEEQQRRFLPLIAAGKLPFYLGYSEPAVGSDLANLRTRAERDGDDWVINGQKLWGTGAHKAGYIWLAARSDPDATPPHAGITVFLIPTGLPGWSAQQHRGLSGEISCSTFFDDVRISDAWRIGDVNGGWKVITDALAGERSVMAGISAELHRELDDLLEALRRDPERAGPRGSAARATITELAARLQATRTLVAASVRATTGGTGARLEAPMAKIMGAELYEDLSHRAIDLLGPAAAREGTVFDYGLRMSVMYVVGGGTNDILRNVVARSLGLPR